MKVYVDEMPRRCLDCICLCSFNDGEQTVYKCPLNNCYISEKDLYCRKSCFLKKQKFIKNKKVSRTHDDRVRADERKKFCEALIKYFKEDHARSMCCEVRYGGEYAEIDLESFEYELGLCRKELDQIEKGENDGSVDN